MGLCEAGPTAALGTEAERRTLILAAGVLVGIERRRWQDCLVKVLDVAHDCRISPYDLAEALIELASGQSSMNDSQAGADAGRIAYRHWGHLLSPPSEGTDGVGGPQVLVW
jgi:hypothetical protein